MFGIKIFIALHCARAPSLAFRCSQRGQDVSSNDTWPFWLSIKHFAHKIIPILFKILASALFLKYSKNFANFSPDILIKHILIKKRVYFGWYAYLCWSVCFCWFPHFKWSANFCWFSSLAFGDLPSLAALPILVDLSTFIDLPILGDLPTYDHLSTLIDFPTFLDLP